MGDRGSFKTMGPNRSYDGAISFLLSPAPHDSCTDVLTVPLARRQMSCFSRLLRYHRRFAYPSRLAGVGLILHQSCSLCTMVDTAHHIYRARLPSTIERLPSSGTHALSAYSRDGDSRGALTHLAHRLRRRSHPRDSHLLGGKELQRGAVRAACGSRKTIAKKSGGNCSSANERRRRRN